MLYARSRFAAERRAGPERARAELPPSSSAAAYTLALLPTVGGHETYHGGALDARGRAVGGTTGPRSELCAVIWERGTARVLPRPGGAVGARATAIAEDGSAVAGYSWGAEGNRAVLWKPQGRGMGARPLQAPNGFRESVALAVNRRGQAIGRAYTKNAAGGEVWETPSVGFLVMETGKVLRLPSPSGWPGAASVFSINEAGTIVGWVLSLERAPRAARWCVSESEAVSIEVLPLLAGRRASRAACVNARGQIVGVSETAPRLPAVLPGAFGRDSAPTEERAVAWWDGRVYDLGGPGSAKSSRANGVNDVGTIVGEYREGGGRYSEGHRRAFVWDTRHGARDLNGLIAAPASRRWVLQGALSINERGQILAYGVPAAANSDGFVRLFLLTPSGTEDRRTRGDRGDQ